MPGDLTDASTLSEAVVGVDCIVFTHGSHGGAAEAEAVDYGAVRNVLDALGRARARIALMTTIGVTKHTPGHDWKRRGERLVRAGGLPYTIVRPCWFDLNQPDQDQVRLVRCILRATARCAGHEGELGGPIIPPKGGADRIVLICPQRVVVADPLTKAQDRKSSGVLVVHR